MSQAETVMQVSQNQCQTSDWRTSNVQIQRGCKPLQHYHHITLHIQLQEDKKPVGSPVSTFTNSE